MAAFGGKPATDWLDDTHPAKRGALPEYWTEVSALPAARVIEVLAASAPNHCLDGWSNLARALSALVAGDPHGARHLAYYAQLRAGLSILANVGIGVFDGINLVIDNAGHVHCLDPKPNGQPAKRGVGTHSAVWDALELWAQVPAQATAFSNLIRLRGEPLEVMIRRVWPGYDPTAVASEMITTWGIDLAFGRQDKDFRNTSSYYPHAFNPLPVAAPDVATFVSGLWDLYEPSGGNNFDFLDRHLIRRILQSQHDLFEDLEGRYNEGAIASKYDQLPDQLRSIASLEFLCTPAADDQPLLLSLAEARTDPASPVEMIARSLMLLRVATGFTNSNLIDSGLAMAGGSLRPWLDEVAVARGFWNGPEAVDQLSDLWTDVEDDLREFRSVSVLPGHAADWTPKAAKQYPSVTEAERIGLWSLTA